MKFTGMSIKLSKGNYGTITIYRDGRPGNICYTGWGRSDARVLCRMLGFKDGDYYRIRNDYYSTQQVYMASLYCTGREPSIYQCENRGWEYSPYYCSRTIYTAGVYCFGDSKYK